MAKDRAIGALMVAGGIVGILLYAYLIYFYAVAVLQITAFVAVAFVLAVLAWVGWSLASTPPPPPLEVPPAEVAAEKKPEPST